MRIARVMAVAVIISPLFAFAQTACSPMSRGSTGPSVLALQKFLGTAYTNFPAPTGYFGAITEAAVKQWQKEEGIVSSGSPATTGWGMVGLRTIAAMKICSLAPAMTPIAAPIPPDATQGTLSTRTLYRGVSGSDVIALQQFLISQKLLAADSATGYFGPLTEAAVKVFQSKNNIASSGAPKTTGYGAVGPRTRSVITAQSLSLSNVPPTNLQNTTPATTVYTPTPAVIFPPTSVAPTTVPPQTSIVPNIVVPPTPTPTPTVTTPPQTNTPPNTPASSTPPVTPPVPSNQLSCVLSATPASVAAGGSFVLSWTSIGTPTSAIMKQGASNFLYHPSVSGGSGGLLPNGSQTVSVGKAGTYTYTLSITNAGGDAACSKDVTVSGTAPLQTIAVVPDGVALGSGADYQFTAADYATRHVIWGGNRPNPSSLVGFYIPYDREPLGNPSVAGAHDREWYRANHPEWLMYKADKTTLATSFTYQSAKGPYSLMPLDITNQAVRDYIWDRRIAPAIARGYKAISFDNVHGVNTDGRVGVFNAAGVWSPLFLGRVSTGNPLQDDPAYYQAVKAWMNATRQRLHEHGVRMIANISYNYAGVDGFLGLSREVDVVLVENAFYQSALCTKDDVHYYNDAAMPSGDHWTRRFNAFRTVAKERGFLLTDGCGTANTSVTSMSNETVSWILANYLLVRGNQTYLSLQSAADFGKTTVRPEFAAADVGAPLGEPTQQGSLWKRQYARGLVIVNPMKVGAASFDLGSIIYTDVYGNTLQGTVSVPPVSGLILIDSGRRVGINVSIPQWTVDGLMQTQVNLGWQLVESASNSRHRINAYLTPLPSGYLASDTWTLSLLARRTGAAPRDVRLNILGMMEQSASVGAMRCALSGTGGVLYKVKGANSSNLDAAASKEGDWYRCSLTVKPSQLNDNGLRLMMEVVLEDGTITYQGDGSSGVILKDIKLEVAGR